MRCGPVRRAGRGMRPGRAGAARPPRREARGHPYKGVSAGRTDWTKGLRIPEAAKLKEVELLFWVGCAGAFDERGQQVTRAMAQVLEAAGGEFAILGNEERCTRAPARRVGNEERFQLGAQENIATLKR